ncbi:lipoprotein insertase outer membrane protein LolB [Parathalassolituus penaei]|uniref:Outer-membrane lipoprotein LolB n=1 Tax=Parathalassolituus penaei TaxID=2997323 RepID=A0A9X3EE93_9GAMM|nr:lipoprotein insertase outer membrane protein LolB [Parathalassolituus penaei]MCY0965988.1 lipoprotein insertase outer membrane protein LolB [Parathalassolituus penaei]
MFARYRFLFLTSLLLMLQACSVLPSKEEQSSALGQLQHWQIQGKLSVRNPKDNITGYVTWEQVNDHFDMFISGPFGRGASRLQGDDHSASLLLPDWSAPQTADSPETLMQEHLGWQFPVRDIRFWVKGQPSPASKHEATYDNYGLTQTLKQHGWEISFSRYQKYGDQWLPGLIKMKGFDYQLTLAVNQWTLHD